MNKEDIVEYLEQNPEFFSDQPELIQSMTIPHECGTAVSLVEFQLRAIRAENKHLNEKMVDLIQVARDNDLLAERMHKLTIEILRCKGMEELVPTIQDVLRDQFGVDIVSFRLFEQTNSSEHLGFRAADDEGWELFKDIISNGKINLGALTPDESAFLFGPEKEQIRSSAVLPLKDEKPIGLLGIGSYDADRFHRQMGTVYLTQMNEIISQALINSGAIAQPQVSNG